MDEITSSARRRQYVHTPTLPFALSPFSHSQSKMTLLQRSSRRYLTQHPWLMGLSVLGVAIGVAVVVSIDLANTSASRAFELSAETVTGAATHQVVGTGETLDDDVYRRLREAGVRPSAPIVEGYATLQRGDRTFQVIGIDPLADAAFRPYLGTGTSGDLDLGAFMTQDVALMSAPTARELSLSSGDTLQVARCSGAQVGPEGGVGERIDADNLEGAVAPL